MTIQLLHHVSLQVADLERSIRFYREVFGLEEIARPPFPFPGAWFRLGDRELHLIGGQPVAPQAAQVDPRKFHVAVRVASFRATLEQLQVHGFREDAAPGDPMRLVVQRTPLTGYPQIYLLDPDGHQFELNAERLDG